jgi:hypothetical protein
MQNSIITTVERKVTKQFTQSNDMRQSSAETSVIGVLMCKVRVFKKYSERAFEIRTLSLINSFGKLYVPFYYVNLLIFYVVQCSLVFCIFIL